MKDAHMRLCHSRIYPRESQEMVFDAHDGAFAFFKGACAHGIYDNPRHDVSVLARKPGALPNGAPFKNWVLPASLAHARRKLRASDDGDQQMVAILAAALSDRLSAVEAACAEALVQRDPAYPRL